MTSANCLGDVSAPAETVRRCFDVHGLTIGVSTNVSRVWEQLPAHLPTGWKPVAAQSADRLYSLCDTNAGTTASKPCYVLQRDRSTLIQAPTLVEALHGLEYDLEIYVVENAPDRVFVHAGVVGWHGRAIVIPGRSYSGKSTLVAALCQAGAAYCSDEYALIDRHGFVHPYPRPLRLRQALPDVVVPPGLEIEPPSGRDALPVGLIVVTHYDPGAVWRPALLSRGQALLEMLSHAMSIQQQPRVVLERLPQALVHARAVRGPRGEAKDTAEHILQWAAQDDA